MCAGFRTIPRRSPPTPPEERSAPVPSPSNSLRRTGARACSITTAALHRSDLHFPAGGLAGSLGRLGCASAALARGAGGCSERCSGGTCRRAGDGDRRATKVCDRGRCVAEAGADPCLLPDARRVRPPHARLSSVDNAPRRRLGHRRVPRRVRRRCRPRDNVRRSVLKMTGASPTRATIAGFPVSDLSAVIHPEAGAAQGSPAARTMDRVDRRRRSGAVTGLPACRRRAVLRNLGWPGRVR